MNDFFDLRRVQIIKNGPIIEGPVLYWMSREQRLNDNWSLIYAQKIALERKKQLITVFYLVNKFLDATIRQYDFMIKGLKDTEKRFLEKNIPFIILTGDPSEKITEYISNINASILITDFDPLKIKKLEKKNSREN